MLKDVQLKPETNGNILRATEAVMTNLFGTSPKTQVCLTVPLHWADIMHCWHYVVKQSITASLYQRDGVEVL